MTLFERLIRVTIPAIQSRLDSGTHIHPYNYFKVVPCTDAMATYDIKGKYAIVTGAGSGRFYL